MITIPEPPVPLLPSYLEPPFPVFEEPLASVTPLPPAEYNVPPSSPNSLVFPVSPLGPGSDICPFPGFPPPPVEPFEPPAPPSKPPPPPEPPFPP